MRYEPDTVIKRHVKATKHIRQELATDMVRNCFALSEEPDWQPPLHGILVVTKVPLSWNGGDVNFEFRIRDDDNDLFTLHHSNTWGRWKECEFLPGTPGLYRQLLILTCAFVTKLRRFYGTTIVCCFYGPRRRRHTYIRILDVCGRDLEEATRLSLHIAPTI